MPEKREIFGPLRPWIAPALGAGLVVAGIAMVAGLASIWAPFVGGVVAIVVLIFGNWRMSRGPRA
jgi:uncharacterized membrane protein YphA (DoxX/SURF4 family)